MCAFAGLCALKRLCAQEGWEEEASGYPSEGELDELAELERDAAPGSPPLPATSHPPRIDSDDDDDDEIFKA